MEIVNETLDSSNNNFLNDVSLSEEKDNQKNIGSKNESVIYSLPPLLSESLNNLVKRLEKTKIPKPPPTKGHSIRKKSRIHTSLPNLFLPSTFDDSKYFNSEKKVQWTNKLNLDLEKMKNLLRDNYANWCKNRLSQSNPNLFRNIEENDPPESLAQNVDFVCSRSKDENNMTIKFTKCDPKITNDTEDNEPTSPIKPNNSISTSENERTQEETAAPIETVITQNISTESVTESDEKMSYSTHLYLDGAIIEPISPASPLQQVLQNMSLGGEPQLDKIENSPSANSIPKIEDVPDEPPPILNSSVPVKNKRGRKPGKKKAAKVIAKKTKPPIIVANSEIEKENENENENEMESIAAPNLEPEINESVDMITIIDLSVNTELESITETPHLESSQQEVKSSPDQTNDLEILSKSITNSVDTSMLPPRKRYKRLMALENNNNSKQQGSPKETNVVETPEEIDSKSAEEGLETLNNIELKLDDKMPTKVSNARSRSKRKKKTVSSIKSEDDKKLAVPLVLEDEIPALSVEPMECVEIIEIPKESVEKKSDDDKVETINKPESLKRSKREAAARGFANMVAMSLNNSNISQSQDSSIESKQNTSLKKSSSSRPDSNDTSSEKSLGKIFKRPRKSKTVEVGPSKSKVKRTKSPVNIPDNNLVESKTKEPEIIDVDKPKITKKSKEKIPQEENPPSPNGTNISNDSSIQEHIKYRKIRTNAYIDPKPTHWYEEVEKCGCKSSKLRNPMEKSEDNKQSSKSKKTTKKRLGTVWDCGDNCLNRLTYTECLPKICQCGDLCANQKIRKGEWAPGLKVKDFPGKGKGVTTTKPIREGTFILEYVGEVINENTFQDRMMNLYREDSHHYCLHLDGEMLIDAYRSGSIARFVNHSCQPNCAMQKWMVNGAYRMCLFSIENIPADAELYYDYNFCSFNTKNTQICLCGAASCRGFIGSKPRAEQTESQKDRKKLLYIFGRLLSGREKVFILRNSIFLLRNRELGKCKRLGIRKPQVSHGNRLPSAISEIKRRKAKKNQFLTQMSALNSIRSIKTRQLQNAQDNESLTRMAQLGQILKDLYNTLLEQKDPTNLNQQLVAPFINCLNRKKYPEFYRMIGNDSIASLSQVYSRLLDGGYMTMMAFDQDILQMLQNVEFYAGKQSNIGQCAERIKPIYREVKINSIGLYEALTDEVFDEKDKQKLISNNLQQITSALAAIKSHNQQTEIDLTDSNTNVSVAAGTHKNKKRKQAVSGSNSGARGRLERGAEVIKCICGFLIEAGHVMVQCDRCFVWQHAYCMNVARSSELADVTRMEPYYCHICLNIPTETLIREIPRHFVISDETIGSDNTLFWTLLKSDNLFKIDDFVYISSSTEPKSTTKSKSLKNSPISSLMMPVDLSQRTIMRIYSLWKDSNGQRWMEGGLFLRPYDSQLNSLLSKESSKVTGTNKRKSSLSAIDLTTHKWHQYEVVYTDFTKILPLDACLGRCFVLNSYTFRHGRPLLQNNSQNTNLDVFVCDWMINQNGEWSELDPGYLKVNTKSYCFDKYQDNSNELVNNERFTRQYLSEDLMNIDEGYQPPIDVNPTNNATNQKLSNEEKMSMKMKSLKKLIDKLSEFACERNKNLPLSSSPSSVSGSTSSRGASPLCENSGSKSPVRNLTETITHGPRKSLLPKKVVQHDGISCQTDNVTTKSSEIIKEVTTLPSEASDNSPQLMIVVDEFQQTPKNDTNATIEDSLKIIEKSSSTDEKDIEEKTVSSVKEIIDDQSNLGSEINFGDFVNFLKNNEPMESIKEKAPPKSKPKTAKTQSKATKKMPKKSKKKVAIKKNDLKPVSEITPAEDEWVPVTNVVEVSSTRPRTRSRKTAIEPPSNEEIEKCTESCSSNNNTEVELILTGLNIKGIFTSNENSIGNSKDSKSFTPAPESLKADDEDDDNTKHCFVKLERMKVKQKKERESNTNAKNKDNSKNEDNTTSKSKIKEPVSVSEFTVQSTTNENQTNPTNSSILSADVTECSKNFNSKSQPNSSSSSVQSDLSTLQIQPSTIQSLHLNKNGSDDNDNNDNKSESKNSNNTSSLSSSLNRSKRKKGVPKRIPFDFSYPQINPLKPSEIVSPTSSDTTTTTTPTPTPTPTPTSSTTITRFDNEVVDLSSCRTQSDQQISDSSLNTHQKFDTPESILSSPLLSNVVVVQNPKPVQDTSSTFTTPNISETRHITAANDFSSIENISSN